MKARQGLLPGLDELPGPPDWVGLPPASSIAVSVSREVLEALAKLPPSSSKALLGLLAHVCPDGTASPVGHELADFCEMSEARTAAAVKALREAGLVHQVGRRGRGLRVPILRFSLDMPFETLFPPERQRAEKN